MKEFICPVCESELIKEHKSYCCKNNHRFDQAKEGYVNLLPSNKKRSKIPGDSKEMIVARREFLDKGYYSKLADEVIKCIVKNCSETETKFNILDAGCGEGYYTNRIESHLKEQQKTNIYAFDVAKEAIRLAAKRNKEIDYFVASSFSLPLGSETFDFIVSIFSPIAHDEFRRVMKSNGKLIVASPAPMHLYELKEELYAQPYKNELKHDHVNFNHLSSETIRYKLQLKSNEDIQSLLKMTPYYWKTNKEKIQKVFSELQELEVTVEFDLSIYELN